MFLVPRSGSRIDDNWYVTGLCGTGSKDIVVEEAFVPEYRTHSYLDAFHLRGLGAAVNDGPLYRLPFGAVFPNSISAPAIGVALGALDAFREQSRARVNVRDGSRLSEDPFTQFRLAESAAEIDGAYHRMRDNMREMMSLARAGEEIPLTRRPATAGIRQGRRLERARRQPPDGGERRPGIFLNNPIQRAWRDIHAMRAHIGNNPERAAAVFGRSEFGLPPTDIRFYPATQSVLFERRLPAVFAVFYRKLTAAIHFPRRNPGLSEPYSMKYQRTPAGLRAAPLSRW